MRNRTILLGAVALLSLAAFACNGGNGGGDDGDPTPAPPGAEPTAAPSATPTVEAPAATPGRFTGSRNPVDVAVPTGMQQATLVNVRAAAQSGFDRIVFEFSGSQVPGYRVEYGAKAEACGSGQDLTQFIGDGKAPKGLMLVTIHNVVAHNEAGQRTAVRALRPGLESIVHAFGTCDFEGVVAYGVAISDEQPFKVSTLPDPPRLVIDIAQ